MGWQFGKIWAVTGAGFILTYGGMSCLRVLALGLHDPAEGPWFTLLAESVFWFFGALLTGLVNAALSVSWIDPGSSPRHRSSFFALGLTSGLLGVYAVDLLGWLAGIAVVVGFVVFVQIIDALPSRMVRGIVAILLVLMIQIFFRSQTYKILRARQTVYFVETSLSRLRAQGEKLPSTLDALQKRLGRVAKLHGIRSVKQDPWRYDYHYTAGESSGHTYLSWGADGLPGPSPAIDPGTPGADIDWRAAGITEKERPDSTYSIRIKRLDPSTGKD